LFEAVLRNQKGYDRTFVTKQISENAKYEFLDLQQKIRENPEQSVEIINSYAKKVGKSFLDLNLGIANTLEKTRDLIDEVNAIDELNKKDFLSSPQKTNSKITTNTSITTKPDKPKPAPTTPKNSPEKIAELKRELADISKTVDDFVKEKDAREDEEKAKDAAKDKAERELIARAQQKLIESQERLHTEFVQRNEDKKTQAELKAIKSRGLTRLAALKDVLDAELTLELANANLTQDQIDLIKEKHSQAVAALTRQEWQKIIEESAKVAQAALDVFNKFSALKEAKEQKELAKYKANSDRRKAILNKQYADGVISKQQYDEKVGQLDENFRKKEHDAKVKAFKRNQKSQIANALINGAVAATNIWATALPGTKLILLALSAINTIASVATIASQKPPEYARGGYMQNGQSHSGRHGGMHVVDPGTGRTVALTEAGEGWVNKRSMASTKQYTVTGTPGQIASAANVVGGGVNFMGGAKMQVLSRDYKAMNYSSINTAIRKHKMYENGGIMTSGNTNNTANNGVNNGADVAVFNELIVQLMQKLNEPMKSYVVYNDIDKAKTTLEGIKQEARLG
jgi:hypothetical protein